MNMSSRRSVLRSAFLPAGAGLLWAAAALAQPANDLCQNAIVIGPGTITGTTLLSSNDGVCSCGSAATSPDVWYSYTPAASGPATLTTCAATTNYDSVLSVHTGCPGVVGNEIACNDDACGFNIELASVSFAVTGGVEYLIRVAGWNSETGDFEMTLSGPGGGGGGDPPPNDGCANAIAVGNGPTAFSTIGATTDSPANCGASGADVWYSYAATATGGVQIDTCLGTTYDSVVAVYSGTCDGGTPTQLACNDDACAIQSIVQFSAVAGQTYLISVGGWSGQTGTGILTIGSGPTPSIGADVTMRDCDSLTNFGTVGGVRGYAISSYTCNLGDANLNWQGNTNLHPILGMHLYRLNNGAIEEIGISWCKNATSAGAGAGCSPSCNGQGGSVLGAGCQDVYGSAGNGIQSNLGPRSDVNAFTGHFNFPHPFGLPSGNAIYKRCQVREPDMNPLNFPGALYFVEGVWVAPDDALAGNGLNNATHRRVSINPTTYDITTVDSARSRFAAIYAWQDHGGGLGAPDPAVQVVPTDVPGEGRFIVGARAYDNGNGTWRYEYAVFNLNSHRSGGSFEVPVPPGTVVTNVGFHDVDYHSGEPFDNADWTATTYPALVRWASPQTFTQNPNSNALRWGTLYNFRFTANVAPAAGGVTLGLFRSGAVGDPARVQAAVGTPGGELPCLADWNHDGTLDVPDIFSFLSSFFGGNADFDNDGVTSVPDIFAYLSSFFTGCS